MFLRGISRKLTLVSLSQIVEDDQDGGVGMKMKIWRIRDGCVCKGSPTKKNAGSIWALPK